MKKLILAFLLLFLFSAVAETAEITLAWDPNTETDLAGYKVHYGNAHRIYSAPIDVGNVTLFTIENLSAGTYYLALTAYDTSGNESDLSYEIVTDLKVGKVTGLTFLKK